MDHAATDEGEWSAERLSRASYRELGSRAETEARFQRHLLSSKSCLIALKNLVDSSVNVASRDYSLEIDVFDLLLGDPILGHFLLRFPGQLMGCLETAIVTAQQELCRQQQGDPDRDGISNAYSVKGANRNSRVHARLIHLPPTCCKLSLGSLQASDVGKIVQCSGNVVRTTPVCMYESVRYFKCGGKQGCGKDFVVEADLEQRQIISKAPDRCKSNNCKGRSFRQVGSVQTDYQEVTIQESASQLGGANVPRSLLVKLEHDLCDTCQPGDEVIIVGLMIPQWHHSIILDADCQPGMALRAHSIRVLQDKGSSAWTGGQSMGADMDEDNFRMEFEAFWCDPNNKKSPIAARDYICKAVCPKLYGMAIIKLALLITLIGGVCQKNSDRDAVEESDGPEPFQISQNQSNTESSTYHREDHRLSKNPGHGKSVQTRRRGQSHLLLVGDPGTGKSQFLRFAAAICPRSVLTTGVGTTSAGLTCAAVRENGKEFSLEAGALVLADQGVCCIDEFGQVSKEDRCTIHEAMEQQTVSVAKAGIICKLNCRATIIAVMNPRDCLYDDQASLSRNTGLGTPLLSRFDVIFKLVDISDAQRDHNVTTYLLNRAIKEPDRKASSTNNGDVSSNKPWTMEKLRAYISFVRKKFEPSMTDAAATLLERHYEKCRSAQSSTIPVTVRFLESLIRLSQAHARLMFHEQVELDDAVAVIRVMESTAFAYGGFDGNVEDYDDILYLDPMTIDFSPQPDFDLTCFKVRILQRYGMQGWMSPEEYKQINKALDPDWLGMHSSSIGRGQGCEPDWEDKGTYPNGPECKRPRHW